MHQEVAPRAFTDQAEIVHKVGLLPNPRIDLVARFPGAVIDGPGRLAGPANALRIVGEVRRYPAVGINRHMEQGVDVSADDEIFASPTGRARHEAGET